MARKHSPNVYFLPPGGLQTLTKCPKHLPQTLTFWRNTYILGRDLPRPLSAPLNPPSQQRSHLLRASGRTHPHTPENSGLYSFLVPFCKKPEHRDTITRPNTQSYVQTLTSNIYNRAKTLTKHFTGKFKLPKGLACHPAQAEAGA